MAVYDPHEQRMAIRVVYDGVACAGKTTNLRQLCTLFAAQRSSELQSPAEMDGRTLFFDWMQVMAGVVCGFPLLCQIVTVPGQLVLTPRRRHLLATADVVVYVCESSRSHVDAARAGLSLVDEVARERGAPLPLVIQANKQDHRDALNGAALLQALGRDGVPVVEGIASEGVGVVDTFVTAVRTVSRELQARSQTGLRLAVRRADAASEVLEQLQQQAIDPAWAAEMVLEEAQAAFLLEEARMRLAVDESERAAAQAASREMNDAIARIEPGAVTPAAHPSFTAPAPSGAPAPLPAAEQPTRPRGLRTLVDERESIPAFGIPSLPSPEVPTGFVWPAHTGRSTLRALSLTGHEGSAVVDDDSVVHHAHGRIVRTCVRDRFPDAEAARQALVRKAREHTQLERLLTSETVLVAQPAVDGACWIWTVRPAIPNIDELLRLTRPPQERSDLLAAYGLGVVDALRAALRHGFSVDFHPRSFGMENGSVRYIGDITPTASVTSPADELTAAIFVAVERIEKLRGDAAPFLDAFERGLEGRLTAEERVRAGSVLPRDRERRGPASRRLYAVLVKASEAS